MFNNDDYTYLFFDKFAGNHNLDNSLTKNITMEHISKNLKTYKIVEGAKACELFNEKFPKFWELNKQMDKVYKPFFLEDKESDIPIYITIIGIDNKLFMQYVDDFNSFPNKNLFTLLAHYHIKYTQNQTLCKKQMTEIYSDIIKNIEDAVYDDKIVFKKFNGINVNLFDYQKKTISWMYTREMVETKIDLCINDMIVINNSVVVNTKIDKIVSLDETKLTIRGGGLIDEMGLGKTIQMTTLSYMNPFVADEQIDKANKILYSKATLILCPNTLCGQWKREIEKVIQQHGKLNIISILTKVHFNKYSYLDLMNADFVIVSFNFLDNKAFLDKVYKSKDVYNVSDDLITSNIAEEKDVLFETEDYDTRDVNLMAIKWHRLVVDEFHETYSVKSRSMLKSFISHLASTYRWCMSGTPYDNSENSFDNIIRFLSNYPALDINLLEQQTVIKYLSTNCFRRNTKDGVENECKLPDISEEVVWLKFTATERMMYNAYMVNENNSKDDVFLRKLCCHPKLADEIKHTLATCKTLEDIEKTMLDHYRDQMTDAEELVDTIKERIVKTSDKIKYIKRKQAKNKTVYVNKILENLDLDSTTITKETIIDNLNEYLARQEEKLIEAKESYKGKLSTYTFFSNVIDKIRSKTKNKSKDDKDNTDDACGICLGNIPEDDIGVTICGHLFCYECLKLSFGTAAKCPYCTRKLTTKDISLISYQRETRKGKRTKKEKLVDKVGTKIGNVIEYLKENDRNVVIFSQWDDLLKKVGKILTEYGIENVFCRGSVYQRDKVIRQFDNSDIRVIMLSSENAASGTNLTKASEIIFLDPVYGSKETRQNVENQAIGRIHRIGQTKDVKITRFIIKDSIENEIYDSNK